MRQVQTRRTFDSADPRPAVEAPCTRNLRAGESKILRLYRIALPENNVKEALAAVDEVVGKDTGGSHAFQFSGAAVELDESPVTAECAAGIDCVNHHVKFRRANFPVDRPLKQSCG